MINGKRFENYLPETQNIFNCKLRFANCGNHEISSISFNPEVTTSNTFFARKQNLDIGLISNQFQLKHLKHFFTSVVID